MLWEFRKNVIFIQILFKNFFLHFNLANILGLLAKPSFQNFCPLMTFIYNIPDLLELKQLCVAVDTQNKCQVSFLLHKSTFAKFAKLLIVLNFNSIICKNMIYLNLQHLPFHTHTNSFCNRNLQHLKTKPLNCVRFFLRDQNHDKFWITIQAVTRYNKQHTYSWVQN